MQPLTCSLAARSLSVNLQDTAGALYPDADTQIRHRQNAIPLFRPFYYTEAVVGKIVTNAQKLQLLGIGQAVKIEVIDLPLPQFVGLDQGEGRTLHRAGVPRRTDKAAAERGLAGAQISTQPDTAAPFQRSTDLRSHALHGLSTQYMLFQPHLQFRRFR